VFNLAFDVFAAYGYSPLRFLVWSFAGLVLLSMMLHLGWDCLGLTRGGSPLIKGDFIQSLFYTGNIVTTLGFTDIIPTSNVGRLFSLALALVGIAWAGLFTTILIRRVLR
jgi:hypothetical protein